MRHNTEFNVPEPRPIEHPARQQATTSGGRSTANRGYEISCPHSCVARSLLPGFAEKTCRSIPPHSSQQRRLRNDAGSVLSSLAAELLAADFARSYLVPLRPLPHSLGPVSSYFRRGWVWLGRWSGAGEERSPKGGKVGGKLELGLAKQALGVCAKARDRLRRMFTLHCPALLDLDADDPNLVVRLVSLVRPNVLNLMNDVQPRRRSPKDTATHASAPPFHKSEKDAPVLAIQPRRRCASDEELTPVRLGSRVRHADRVGSVVFERRVELVVERVAPEGFSSGPISERVSGLQHLRPSSAPPKRERERHARTWE